MNTDLMFSSKEESWSTPQKFFEELDKEFHFDLDPCASVENAKCSEFYTKEQDGLQQDWGGEKSFLQSSIRKIKNRGMDSESISGKSKTGYCGCLSCSVPNRYQMVS